jgi:type IV secretion system protein VirB5
MAFGCLCCRLVWPADWFGNQHKGDHALRSRSIVRQAQRVAPANIDYQPTDAQIAYHLARFIEDVRGLPADGIVLRQNWLRAYDFTTDRGAGALNDYARNDDPFAKLGKAQISVDVSSVIRASPDSFRIAWIQRIYDNGSLSATERDRDSRS